MNPNHRQVAELAARIFERNARNFRDWEYEWGVNLYWTPDGRAVEGTPTMGDRSEVVMPDESRLGVLVGSVHSHPDGEACLSDFDRELGQKLANESGHSHAMYVIGWDADGENVVMVEEVFEPEVAGQDC